MSGVPQGSILGLVLFSIIIYDIVRLSVPSAILQMTSNSVVQSTCLRDRMPSRET